jgi:hypothetical protein
MSLQTTPVPVYPVLQVHVREPTVFWHCAVTAQPPLLFAHSLMSVHPVPASRPSPPYPDGQTHE